MLSYQEAKMEMLKVLQLPDELLHLWHSYRTELILSVGLLLALFRLAVHWRRRRRQTLTSRLYPKVDAKWSQRPSTSTPQDAQASSHTSPVKPTAKSPNGPRRVKGNKRAQSSRTTQRINTGPTERIQPYIFYFTLGGATKRYAERLGDFIVQTCLDDKAEILSPLLHDLSQLDYDDYFITPPTPASFYCFLIPSYNIDSELSNFLAHMQETHHDFRIDTAPLSSLSGYSVFGFGDRQDWPTEQEGFCSQAIEVDKWMAKLTGRKRAFPLGLGDVRTDAEQAMTEWAHGVDSAMRDLANGIGLGEGVPGSGDAVESGDEGQDDDFEDGLDHSASTARSKRSKLTRTDDLEDLKVPIPVDFTTSKAQPSATTPPKAMVPINSPTYASLTKQGYTIVGTHSGVKICRWTKSALRGRGSCYKYSFYGISSHLCMEATPSLSCSNKCVFCWRHGTNPVGTTWRWTVDPPDLVFDGMKAGHYKKIKMMKGVPGVRAERFQEAMQIRHCALSLVGEPIFYPHINELLAMLHKERISSFLVCNAQHPDQLATLGPVTQLYVSIDASNKESLRRIDRPLHRDFWERFLRCMDILKQKRFTHRTVFRLTLVKGFNIEEEAEGYAELVERALPAFVEVKGVTYCGTSTAAGAGLSMANVPFYEEVTAFVLALEAALKRRGLEYGVAAEHAHSCCVLLADRTRFWRDSGDGDQRWHTLIDYARFFECLESGDSFGPEDYIGMPTPEWALWGNGGFDPRDQRVDKKGRPKVVEID